VNRGTAGGATLSALAAAAVVIAAAATTAPGARAASFTGIGDLPGGTISGSSDDSVCSESVGDPRYHGPSS
jgi:hypothetical protein